MIKLNGMTHIKSFSLILLSTYQHFKINEGYVWCRDMNNMRHYNIWKVQT
jgi:hypothetical protein